MDGFFCIDKLNNLIGVLLISGCIAWHTWQAHRGRRSFIRSLPALSAIEDAVGRAVEMGRPVLYIPGIADIDDAQTLASVSVLERVAEDVAAYDMPLLVPNCCSMVMSMTQEVVRSAYAKAGHPESFQSDYVRYLCDEQFGFAAGASGIMMRERPAAIFYIGNFLGEALILAENGNASGAVQVAGTATVSQLPFFVASCDYTLIGEELYAASAYLSQDPMQIGSLKGQDMVKAVIMVIIVVGTILYSLGFTWIKDLLAA
ncbi:MAG: hypothetical protein Q4F00_11505 [bacterium]|nr:hypothetical protein [bacterium]